MKTSNLTGPQLDYWVAKAEGAEDAKIEDWGGLVKVCVKKLNAFEPIPFLPSTKWSDGGPIIERERYSFATIGTGMPDENGNQPVVCIGKDTKAMTGSTHLIAAMRCYVQSKFGEEVSE